MRRFEAGGRYEKPQSAPPLKQAQAPVGRLGKEGKVEYPERQGRNRTQGVPLLRLQRVAPDEPAISRSGARMKSTFVEKVWGREEIISPRGKVMHLNKGAQCSYHRHEKKEEYFFVLSGSVRLEIGGWDYWETFDMQPGDIVHIPIGTYHSFMGLEDSKIIETSLQDDDPEDSYRLTESRRGVL
jgi:mannose-6-phosphate isomerase-like protein (cupin superfamily)